MPSGIPARLTSAELALLSLSVVCAIAALFINDGALRLTALILGGACGGGVYLLVARRLNETHVDAVLATRPEIGPDDGRDKIIHVDPTTKRLVFEDYAPAFSVDDDDYEAPPLERVVRVPPPPTTETPALVANPDEGIRILRPETPIRVKDDAVPAAQPAPTVTRTRPSPEAQPAPAPQTSAAPPAPTHRRKELNVSIPELFDFAAIQQQPEPRNEFDWLLHRVLETIGTIVPAHSVAFFWIDRARNQLIVESKITQSTSFSPRRRLEIGQDIVGQIAVSGLPEIVTEIQANAEQDLIGYYTQPEGIGSFVGVPVYFNHEAVAVLTLDAKEPDAYDARTVWVLGHFTKIISGLIRGYTDKYDLHLSARAVDAVGKLRAALPPTNATSEKIARALLDVAEDIVEWEWAGTALLDAASSTWVMVHYDAKQGTPNLPKRQSIDLQNSIVGGVIRSGQSAVIGDLTGMTRYARNEPATASGSFLCLPLSTPLRSYGALCVEHTAGGHFSQHDVNTLVVLAQSAAASIESHHLNKMIDEQLMIDERTGVYNKRFLLSRLDEDVTRAQDFKQDVSLVLFGIDDFVGSGEKPPRDKIDSILTSVVRTLQQHVRTYDVVGRYDQDRLGVVLIGRSDDDAYLWTEKVRKEVASTILMLGSRKMSVTASAGICGLRGHMTHVDLVNGALQALQRAQEIGGNTVMIF